MRYLLFKGKAFTYVKVINILKRTSGLMFLQLSTLIVVILE